MRTAFYTARHHVRAYEHHRKQWLHYHDLSLVNTIDAIDAVKAKRRSGSAAMSCLLGAIINRLDREADVLDAKAKEHYEAMQASWRYLMDECERELHNAAERCCYKPAEPEIISVMGDDYDYLEEGCHAS